MVVVLAAGFQAANILLWLETGKGLASRKTSRTFDVLAFAATAVAAFGLAATIMPRRRSQEAQEDRAWSDSLRSHIGAILAGIGAGGTIALSALGSRLYNAASGPVDTSLKALLDAQPTGCQSSDPSCGTDHLSKVLQAQANAGHYIDALKAACLTILAITVAWSSYEALRAVRNEASAASLRPVDGLERDKLTSFSLMRTHEIKRRESSQRRPGSTRRSDKKVSLSRTPSNCSNDFMSKYSSSDSTAAELEVPPLSYRGHDARSISRSSHDDSDADSEKFDGVELDTSSEVGAELDRKFGSGDDATLGYYNHHVARAPSVHKKPVKSAVERSASTALANVPKVGDVDSESFASLRGSASSAASTATRAGRSERSIADAVAARLVATTAQLKGDRSRIRWDCALALGAVALYGLALGCKLTVGDEVELGQRPNLALAVTAWMAMMTNVHLIALIQLMCRGSGSAFPLVTDEDQQLPTLRWSRSANAEEKDWDLEASR